MDATLIFIAAGLFCIALLYSSVGHAGASGYLAILSLSVLSPDEIKPISLVLNIAVAAITTWRFIRAGYFSRRIFLWFAIGSVPASYFGGFISLPDTAFRYIAAGFLLFSAGYMIFRRFFSPQDSDQVPRHISASAAAGSGALIGFSSGLIGVGGGIFLSPLLYFMRATPMRTISGISAAFILVNSTVGLAGHLTRIQSLPPMIPWWISVVIAGGAIGSWLGTRIISNRGIYLLLSAVLLFAGVKMLL